MRRAPEAVVGPSMKRAAPTPGAVVHWPRAMEDHEIGDEIGEILVTAEQLQRRVRELGEQISRDYAGRDLLMVGVLKGAVFFLSDLMRHVDTTCEVDFMAVASYGSATGSSSLAEVLQEPPPPRHRTAAPVVT